MQIMMPVSYIPVKVHGGHPPRACSQSETDIEKGDVHDVLHGGCRSVRSFSPVLTEKSAGRLIHILSPHYSRSLLLQPPIRKSELIAVFFLRARNHAKGNRPRKRGGDAPDGGQARPSIGQHTVSSMLPFLTAPHARLAWRLSGFVTNPRE